MKNSNYLMLFLMTALVFMFPAQVVAQEPQDCVQIYERYDPTGYFNVRLYNPATESFLVPDYPVDVHGEISPDGQYRAFLYPSYDGEGYDLNNSTFYIRDLTNDTVQTLAEHINDNTLLFYLDMAWSPDGSQVALLAAQDGQPFVMVASVDGGEMNRVPITGMATGLIWSDDGSLLGTLDGENVAAVFDSQTLNDAQAELVVPTPIAAPTPALPDAELLGIVNESWQVLRVNVEKSSQVIVFDSATGTQYPLLENEAGFLDFYTNGQQAAIQYLGDVAEAEGLYVFSVDDFQVHFIPQAVQPAWSPDGSHMVYRRWGGEDRLDTVLEIVETDTFMPTNTTILNNDGQFSGMFAWGACEPTVE